jgi:hypothetical protein
MSDLEILDVWIIFIEIDTPLHLNFPNMILSLMQILDPEHAFPGDKQSRKCRPSRSFMCMDQRASYVVYPAW